MTADALVDVPDEVAVALHDVAVLDEHHRTVEAVVAHAQVVAAEPGVAREPLVVRESEQRWCEALDVVDARHHLVASAVHRPPRPRIAGNRAGARPLDVVAVPLDLPSRED